MSQAARDILEEIPDQDLPKLAEMYEKHKNWAPHAYSTITTAIEWKKKSREKYSRVYSPNGCWKEDGTFFVIFQKFTLHAFIFTLDKTGSNVQKALTESNRLEGVNLLLAIHETLYPIVKQVLDGKKLGTRHALNYMFSISQKEALRYDMKCPPGVYVNQLDETHAPIINDVWPHRFENSEKLVALLIEFNYGYGVFLKANDELVSWILISFMGQLGLLQTKEGYTRRGYASLVTKYMSKELARRGHNAFATVLVNNTKSIRMFEKLGFKRLGYVTYIEFD